MPTPKLRQRPQPGHPKPARPNTPPTKLHTKRRGDLAELSFLSRAAHEGLDVAKPYGDNNRYDFIVDNGHKRSLVQVKSTGKEISKHRYHVNAGRRLNLGAVPYTKSEIDFLAVYLHPEKTWYILPFKAFRGQVTLALLSKHHPGHNSYSRYLEAWHLLKR